MDKKKLNRIVMVMPVVLALLVVGGVVGLVLSSGGNGAAPAADVSTAQLEAETGVVPGEGVPGAVAGSPAYTGDGAPHEAIGPSCAFDFLIGQSSEQALAQITPLGRPYRVLTPGAMVTQDYSAERINLTVDENGIVQSVDCG